MTTDARAVVEPALGGAKATVQIIADCRYVGQGHEIRISVPLKTLADADGKKLKAAFEAQYEQVYGLAHSQSGGGSDHLVGHGFVGCQETKARKKYLKQIHTEAKKQAADL